MFMHVLWSHVLQFLLNLCRFVLEAFQAMQQLEQEFQSQPYLCSSVIKDTIACNSSKEDGYLSDWFMAST